MESTDSQHAAQLRQGERFAFGANWRQFLTTLTAERVEGANQSLRQMLGRESLDGLTFLDAGSGSGLLSLAAYQLGASVHSFDFDLQSVACTAELRARYACDESRWKVEVGSVLDDAYMANLGKFDIVYSWGVLHHTGDQRSALEKVMKAAAQNGIMFIALYNDQGWLSKYWWAVKRLYNRRPFLRAALVALHAPYLFFGRLLVRTLRGNGRAARGMSLWYDMVDWLGGWPFEVSRPSDIVAFCESRGFKALKIVTVGNRPGCNEFVFAKTPTAA